MSQSERKGGRKGRGGERRGERAEVSNGGALISIIILKSAN